MPFRVLRKIAKVLRKIQFPLCHICVLRVSYLAKILTAAHSIIY
nr:MAG TPA: hypothetical protein [Caudoviricetes sp.]